MNMKKLSTLLLAVVMLLSVLAGCVKNVDPTTTVGGQVNNPTTNKGNNNTTNNGKEEIVVETFEPGDYIWKTSVSTLASNWNPHTYQTNDDSLPLDYTTSGLYTFLFNDGLHPVEGKEPYAGYVIVPEMAAEMPEDVTAWARENYPKLAIPAAAEAGYAYKIVLNSNICWDDGTPITAETFVQSYERLFRPALLNYRASDWYGQTLSIAGAANYVHQGESDYIDDASQDKSNMVKNEDGTYSTVDGYPVYIAVHYPLAWTSGNTLKQYVDTYADQYFGLTYWQNLVDAMDENGLVALNDENYAWLLDVITTNPNWGESEADICNYFVYYKAYPETWSFDDVGVIALSDYELLIVLGRSLAGFGLLFNLSGFANNLVKIDLYDSCLTVDTSSGSEVWTSTYGTSAETSVSYGPYKLGYFESAKAMRFVKNDKWWGYTDETHVYQDPVDGKYYRMYQTTQVNVEVIQEASTRKLMFMKGELMSYGLQADDYATLRYSDYCYATPATATYFLILNGHMESIQNREAAENFDKNTRDLEMLSNTAFHRAIGLSFDKDLFASTISPARSGAFGIIGSAYIYDPDTGAKYRDSDQAKKVLCDFYGVDYTKFDSLDAAVDSITGYDPTQAKAFYEQAFREGLELGYITDADNDGKCDQIIEFEYAISSDSDFQTTTINYMNDKIQETAAGTPFDGKIKIVKSPAYGTDWSKKIKEGLADTVLGGWSGSMLDPFGLTDLYTNPSYQYDAAWYDATKINLTINVPVNGENKDVELTLRQWSMALNGTAVVVDGVTYNYGSGQCDVEIRLNILAAIEGKILESYNYLPMLEDGSMALLSQQVYYVVEEYNPIMGRGGIAYTKYNFNEDDWKAHVTEQGGELTY